MLYPSVDEIREKVDSKYATVILAAKRARDIVDGAPPLREGLNEDKAVSAAAYEIAEGYITPIEYDEEGQRIYNEEDDAEKTNEFEELDVFADVEAIPVEVVANNAEDSEFEENKDEE